MVEFIFTIILMISLGFILYLMVRALPRVVEDEAQESNFLDRWAHSQIPEKVDAALNLFLLKFLRKTKIVILKFDNVLGRHLQKMKPEADSKKPTIDFKDVTGQNKEGESQ